MTNFLKKVLLVINNKKHLFIQLFIFLSICTVNAAPVVAPNIVTHQVDWTILGSFAMALIALVLTIYQIMQFFVGPKKLRDESLRASDYIKELQTSIGDLDEKYENLLTHIGDLDMGAVERRTMITNMQNQINEIRREQRELSRGLDNLLRQLIDYFGSK